MMEGYGDKDSVKIRAEIQKKIALLRKDLDDKEKCLKHTQKKARRKLHIQQKLKEHSDIKLSPVAISRPSVVSFQIDNESTTTQDSHSTSSDITVSQDSITRKVSRRKSAQLPNNNTSLEPSVDFIHSSLDEQPKKTKKRQKVARSEVDWSLLDDDFNDMYSGIKRRKRSCRESQESQSSHTSSLLIKAKDFDSRRRTAKENSVKNASKNVRKTSMNKNSSPLKAESSPIQIVSDSLISDSEDMIPSSTYAPLSILNDRVCLQTESDSHDAVSQSPPVSSQFPLTPDLFEAEDLEEETTSVTPTDSDSGKTNSSNSSERLNLCFEELKTIVNNIPVAEFSLSEEYSELMTAKTATYPCLQTNQNKTDQRSLPENSDVTEIAHRKRTPFLMSETVDITRSFKSSKKASLCLPSAIIKVNAMKHLIQCGDAVIAACDYRLHSYDSHTGELIKAICIDRIIPPDTDQYDIEDLTTTWLNNEAVLIVTSSTSSDRVCCFLNSELDEIQPTIRRMRVFGDCLSSVTAVSGFFFMAVVDMFFCSSLLLSYNISDEVEKSSTVDGEITSLTLIQKQQNVMLVVTKKAIHLWSVKCNQSLKSIKFESPDLLISRHAFDCKGILLLPVLDDNRSVVLAINPSNGSLTEVYQLKSPLMKSRWKSCLMIGHLICAQTQQHQLFIWSAISGRCLGCSKVKVHQVTESAKSLLLNTSEGFRYFSFSI